VLRERRANGLEYLALATQLLQAARRRVTYAGVWEAADLRWSCARTNTRIPDLQRSGWTMDSRS
jgi:hypothetical protein